ncbi:MAG: hypothetical protein ACRC6M_18210, partial [Microcystaceae cyanobacterium]
DNHQHNRILTRNLLFATKGKGRKLRENKRIVKIDNLILANGAIASSNSKPIAQGDRPKFPFSRGTSEISLKKLPFPKWTWFNKQELNLSGKLVTVPTWSTTYFPKKSGASLYVRPKSRHYEV